MLTSPDIRNITLTDLHLTSIRGSPFSISQCTSYSGAAGDCDSSTFKISDVTFENVQGTAATDVVAVMQCSAAAGGCDGIEIENVVVEDDGVVADQFLCSNVEGPVGFECTGDVVDNPGGS